MSDNNSVKNNTSHSNTHTNKCSITIRNPYFIHLDSLVISYRYTPGNVFNLDIENPTIFKKIADNQKLYITDKQKNKYLLKKSKNLATHYNYSYDVYFNDTLFGLLNFGHRNNQNDLVSFKVNNEYLYTHLNQLIKSQIILFTDGLDLIFNNINYLEVANDTIKPLADKFGYTYYNSQLIKHCENPLYKFGKDYKINSHNNFGGFSIGSKRNSGKIISIYDKTIEVNSKSKKYKQLEIINEALQNTEDKNVNRVEIKLTTKGIKSIQKKTIIPIDLDYVFNHSNICNLFKYAVGNLFIVSDLKKGKYDNNRNMKYDKIDLLPLDNLGDLQTFNYTYKQPIEDRKDVYKKINLGVQRGLKANFDSYLYKGESKYLDSIKEGINNNILYKKYNSEYVTLFNKWFTSYSFPTLKSEASFSIDLLKTEILSNVKEYKNETDFTANINIPTENKTTDGKKYNNEFYDKLNNMVNTPISTKTQNLTDYEQIKHMFKNMSN